MRIGFNIDTKNIHNADTGKLKFIIRLSKEMESRGIKIDNDKPDIFLGLPKYSLSSMAKINVLRLDGVTFNTTKKVYKKRIKKLFSLIRQSDAIVYQSNFCKEAHNKFLDIRDDRKYKIIFNGVSPEEFPSRNLKNYFLASAKWRGRKRLRYIVESFLEALDVGLDSDLVVTGEPDYICDHHRVKYLPWQDRKQMKVLLSEAIASLHLNWLDCFPNSMVESIVAGCPVIYTDSGGQVELAKDSGIKIKDKIWNFKPYDTNIPPSIDKKEVATAMIKIKNDKKIIEHREDLHIGKVCDQYIDFFEELLSQ